MIQSSTGEPKVTFAFTLLHHTEKRWEKHWLKKVRDKVNWKKFFWRFEKLHAKDNGRPAWDPVLLFRCLLLAEWYGLSDRQLEEAVEFRIDFRKFVGLSFEEEAPDATTFSAIPKCPKFHATSLFYQLKNVTFRAENSWNK